MIEAQNALPHTAARSSLHSRTPPAFWCRGRFSSLGAAAGFERYLTPVKTFKAEVPVTFKRWFETRCYENNINSDFMSLMG